MSRVFVWGNQLPPTTTADQQQLQPTISLITYFLEHDLDIIQIVSALLKDAKNQYQMLQAYFCLTSMGDVFYFTSTVAATAQKEPTFSKPMLVESGAQLLSKRLPIIKVTATKKAIYCLHAGKALYKIALEKSNKLDDNSVLVFEEGPVLGTNEPIVDLFDHGLVVTGMCQM